MKTVFVLLAIAVTYVCSFTTRKSTQIEEKKLKEMITDLDHLLNNSKSADQLELIFVTELHKSSTNVCNATTYCQFEKVLTENMSKLPGPGKQLIRKLNAYSKQENCTVGNSKNEIPLHHFLEKLKKCIQKSISQLR